MATVTEPAAATSPAETAAAPEAAREPGPLARILTPVEPARPVKPLGTTVSMGEVSDSASSRGSGSTKAATAKDSGRDSAVGALVRALAARLGRTGTSVKRTHDVKETRVSGSTSTGTNKAERTHRHDGKNHASRDAKVADLNNKQQHGKTNHDRKQTAATDAKTSRASKADTAAHSNRDAKQAATTVTASKPDGRVHRDTGTAKGSDTKTTAPGSPKPASPARPAGPDMVKRADPKGLNAKTAAAAKRAGVAPVDLAKGATAPSTKPPTEPDAPKLRTRPAREAGYRDGTRVAATVGQARAYRDGAVDGWDDRTAADKAEGKTMTDTRARNATKPQQPPAPKMAPASGSTVDLAKKPAPAAAAVPVTVTAVGDKAIGFTGADGEPHTMSRGEVRTLKAFERRLADKKTAMGRIEEGSKATRLQAADLATRAQRLAEDAKTVKGGAGIVAVLLRLAERAQVLRLKAVEIEKNARRGSEAVRTLAANANTRHGGIYRAVVDSPLTTPAEREFYMDRQGV